MALSLPTYQALSFSSVGKASSESSAIMAKSEKQYSDLGLLFSDLPLKFFILFLLLYYFLLLLSKIIQW